MSGENRTLVSRGLASIDHSDFIGLHALLQEAGLSEKAVTSVQIGFVLAPRINAAGRMGEADKAAELLLSSDPAEAARLARGAVRSTASARASSRRSTRRRSR